MALDQYANIAEIVGVVVVIVTLVFLTLQIRQNTRAIRSTTIQAVMQSEMAFSKILIEHSDTWNKILTAEPLAVGEETRKAIVLFNVFMIDTESRYHQYNTGYLDVQAWEGRLGTLPEVTNLPVYQMWKTSFGGMSHSADFLKLLENQSRGHMDEHEYQQN
jgi:hypothetical protein